MMSPISNTENQLLQEPQNGKPAKSNFDFSAKKAQNPLLGPLGSLSVYGLEEKEHRENATGKTIPKSRKKSATDLVLETYTRSLSWRMSKFGSLESFVFPSTQNPALDSSLSTDSIPVQNESSEWSYDSVTLERPKFEDNVLEMGILDPPTSEEVAPRLGLRRTYSVSKKRFEFGKIPLPQSAATFYNGSSLHGLEVVQACQSIERLNQYLRERKNDLREGVPGLFLHAVIGQEVSDVGSIAATILYAFYLHGTLGSSDLCTLPVVNMRRSDLNMHAELRWLFDSCHIDISHLVFIDEIDLSYYDLFGCLKLVQLNGHKLPTKLEAFKEALVEIFNCKQANSPYPWVKTVTMGEDCSCCTLIAEKFVKAWPEMLAGQGFSRLLLAGILLDTANLTSVKCTSKDKYMATLLIGGAGRFGCSGLYQMLKYKMFDKSDLKVKDILLKDFKKWSRAAGKPDSKLTASHVGMSSIGISLGQLLSHEAYAAEEVILFQKLEKLRLLMVVSGYYDSDKNFKREILVATDTAEHMRNLLNFFNTNSSQLPLKVLIQPGLREELRAFEIDNKKTSRKTIERLLEEFGGTAERAKLARDLSS